MNLLAHAVLSPSHDLVMVGNVLADFMSRTEKASLGPELRLGVELHARIDKFTDSHPIVDRSKAKLIGFQRYGNALVDVFYDHFLTNHWTHLQPVREFTNDLYSLIRGADNLLPEACRMIAGKMMDQDWMNHYGTVAGLELNLRRMEARIEFRTGRTVDLVSSLQTLDKEYRAFEVDFLEFWPELQGNVSMESVIC